MVPKFPNIGDGVSLLVKTCKAFYIIITKNLLSWIKKNLVLSWIKKNLAENEKEYNLKESENNIKGKNNLKRLIGIQNMGNLGMNPSPIATIHFILKTFLFGWSYLRCRTAHRAFQYSSPGFISSRVCQQ